MIELKNAVHKIDPDAFITIVDVSDVRGNVDLLTFKEYKRK